MDRSKSTTSDGGGGSLLEKKRKCEKLAQEIVIKLIEPGVTTEFLLHNVVKVSRQNYADVMEERSLAGLCGWALCDNPAVPVDTNKKQGQFVIRANQVLDVSKRRRFCRAECYGHWTHLLSQLPKTPLWMRRNDPQPVLLSEDIPLHGIVVDIQKSATIDSDSSQSDEEEET